MLTQKCFPALSAAWVTYAGPLNAQFRQRFSEQVLNLLGSIY